MNMNQKDKKIICLQCLARKEKIDSMERRFLMLETWIKHLRADITHAVEIKNQLDQEITELKKTWETEFIGCIGDV